MSTSNGDEDLNYLENSATKEENISNVLHEISESVSHGRDLIFICGQGQQLPFHQALVTPYSKFLSELVDIERCCSCKSRSCVNRNALYISLPDIEPIIIASLMQCIYTGRCNSFDVDGTDKLSKLVSLLGFNIDIELFMAFSGNKGTNEGVEEITLDEDINDPKDIIIHNSVYIKEKKKDMIPQIQSKRTIVVHRNETTDVSSVIESNLKQSQTEVFQVDPEIILVDPQSGVNKNVAIDLFQNGVVKSNPPHLARMNSTEIGKENNFFSSPESGVSTTPLSQKVQKGLIVTNLEKSPISVITERKPGPNRLTEVVVVSVNEEPVQTTKIVNHIYRDEDDLAPKKAKRNINPKKERGKSSVKENESIKTSKQFSNDTLELFELYKARAKSGAKENDLKSVNPNLLPIKAYLVPSDEQLGYSCHYKTSSKNTNHVSKPGNFGYVKLQDICQFKCTRKDDLTEHIKSSHGEIVYTCYNFSCTFGAATKSDLLMHTESVHKRPYYMCNYTSCTFGNLTKNGVKNHIKSKHETPDEVLLARYENQDKVEELHNAIREGTYLKNGPKDESRTVPPVIDTTLEKINNLFNFHATEADKGTKQKEQQNMMVGINMSKESKGESEKLPKNVDNISNKDDVVDRRTNSVNSTKKSEKVKSLSVDESEISDIDTFLDLMEVNVSTVKDDEVNSEGGKTSSDNFSVIPKVNEKISPLIEDLPTVNGGPITIEDSDEEDTSVDNSPTITKSETPLESSKTEGQKEKECNRKRNQSEPAFKIKISKSNFIFNKASAQINVKKNDDKAIKIINEKDAKHCFDSPVQNVEFGKSESDNIAEKCNILLNKAETMLLKDKMINESKLIPSMPGKSLFESTDNSQNRGKNQEVQISDSKPESIEMGEQKNGFSCNICEFKTSKLNHLNRHKMEQHQDINIKVGSSRPFSCSICSQTFKRKEHLQNHKVAKHRTENIKKMNENQEKIVNKATESELNQSENPPKRIKIDNEKYAFTCDICALKTTTLQNLKRHKMETHEGIRYPCSYCSDKFKRKEHLQRHIKLKHGNVFQFSPQSKSSKQTQLQ